MEEADAIWLCVQYNMCEKPVGRYESHKLSCKSEREDGIIIVGVTEDCK